MSWKGPGTKLGCRAICNNTSTPPYAFLAQCLIIGAKEQIYINPEVKRRGHRWEENIAMTFKVTGIRMRRNLSD
jgi:hypothetical protein